MSNQIKLNRNNTTHKILNQFDNEVKKEIFKNQFDTILNDISAMYKIPLNVLKLKANQIIYNDYNFKNNKFNNLHKYSTSYLYYSLSIICLNVFNLIKKNFKHEKKYDLILPDIEQEEQILRLKNIFNKKKILCIFKKNSTKNKVTKNLFHLGFDSISENSIRFDQNNFLECNKIFKILNETLKISKKYKINYFFLICRIFVSIFRNSSTFKVFNSKFLLIDRFYSSCAIRDFYFKKYDGKISMSTQKSLLETSLTKYSSFDVLFTLGKEKIIQKNLDKYTNIKKIYPLGSFFYEHRNRLNKISKKKDYEFDIVYLGINFTRSVFISNEVINGYFKALNWLKKYSIKNPHLKILIKHHDKSIVTNKERKIFENSNVKFVENSNFYGESYDYCFNSKIICSFGSALLLESSIFNKNIFFLNPNNLNKNFFKIQKFEKVQIRNYKEMEKKFSDIFIWRKKNPKNFDKYCLKGYPTESLIKFINTKN